MLYLGIDIGKNSHVATLIDKNKTILFKTFSFPNSVEVAEFLIQKLPSSDVEIGMEATGHYWLSLYSFLISKDFNKSFINFIYQINLEFFTLNSNSDFLYIQKKTTQIVLFQDEN